MRIVTTYPPRDREAYVERNVQSWLDNFEGADIQVYSEEPEKPLNVDRQGRTSSLNTNRLMDCDKLKDFLRSIELFGPAWGKFGDKYDYNYDIGKFCRKVFAQYEAAQDYEGVLLWLDADVECLQSVPREAIDRVLRGNAIALYQRPQYHSECGIMAWRLPDALPMFQACRNLYTTGQIFRFARGWHDCWAWDLVVEHMQVHASNLSPMLTEGLEVVSASELGAFFRHDKGQLKYA